MLLSELSFDDCPPVLSTENMRALDSASKHILGELGDFCENKSYPNATLAGFNLMKEAGFALFQKTIEKIVSLSVKNPKVAIFIGGGNNGGDGLVLAKLLQEKGLPFTAYALTHPNRFKNEAAIAFDEFSQAGGKLVCLEERNWPIFHKKLNFDLVIDCMLGNGASGELRPLFAQVVKEINSWQIPVIAADAPTGYDSSAHREQAECIQAIETLLFGFPRIDAYAKEGKVFGTPQIAPLHYPPELVQKYSEKNFLATSKIIPLLLPERIDFGDKRSQGCALIVAGSANMTGAAFLCTEAALRSGAGLVTLATPQRITPILQARLVEPVFCALNDQESGLLQPGNVPLLLQRTTHNDAIAIGPGLSTENSVKETILDFLSKIDDKPVVIDADALNAIAQEPSILQAITVPAILTPHVREWERLFGKLPENANDIADVVRSRSSQTGKVLLLKSNPIFIGLPDGRVYIVPARNSGMSKGGCGDVLTGIIVSLLSQGLPIGEAAVLGALLHQKAGEITRQELGAFSMQPSDIIQKIHKAFAS